MQPVHTKPRMRTIAIATAAAMVAATLAGSATAVAVAAAGPWQRHSGDNTQAVRAAIEDAKAKNVILLIGDGMGDSEITIARNYAYGAAGELPGIDALPLTGSYTTYSLYKDGAEQGQARLRARLRGHRHRVGDRHQDLRQRHLGRHRRQAAADAHRDREGQRLRTGDVSTAEIQDATPAVQVAHVDARSCYGPDSHDVRRRRARRGRPRLDLRAAARHARRRRLSAAAWRASSRPRRPASGAGRRCSRRRPRAATRS